MLLFLMGTTVASAEGDSYWAVAHGSERIELWTINSSYGAAWNYPSREEAEKGCDGSL